MHERIKLIRKENNLNQKDFGARIGVSRDTIANIEADRIEIKDIFITSICREFSISEEWLRNGTGEMRRTLTQNQEIAQFVNEIMSEADESFRKRLIVVLSKLNPNQWALLADIAQQLNEPDEKEND